MEKAVVTKSSGGSELATHDTSTGTPAHKPTAASTRTMPHAVTPKSRSCLVASLLAQLL
uniref:Uncharacterized protein n=1 Tax=Fagus sylvatica TaxID=28930 RepID=A0A2N9EFN3_FAGSY